MMTQGKGKEETKAGKDGLMTNPPSPINSEETDRILESSVEKG